jgi:hypothetical protein
VILDSGIKDIETAIKAIKQTVFARLLPARTQTYAAGQPVSFGAVTIHKQIGLQLDGKLYAWASIMDMVMEAGRFTLTLRDRQRHEARVRDVPNIELLGQLIGRQFFETGLAYY